MFYGEFRGPQKWGNGNYGMACICSKGLANYVFPGQEDTTKALAACKIGDTVSFDDEYWGQKRKVFLTRTDKGWDFSSQFPEKERTEPCEILNEYGSKGFQKALKRVNIHKFYSSTIIITTDCTKKGLNDDKGEIYCVVSDGVKRQLVDFLYNLKKNGKDKEEPTIMIRQIELTKSPFGSWGFDNDWELVHAWFRNDSNLKLQDYATCTRFVRPNKIIVT